MKFRLDIQGLRAISFLLVFFFHLDKSLLSGGFVGVDIFLVISGFLITSIILNQKEKGMFSFLQFYSKRVIRIIPAVYVMIIITSIIGIFTFLYSDIYFFRNSLLSSLLFISNIFFSQEASYFGASSIENPLLHTWSLSVEMQFYFILPLILVFVNRKYLKTVVLSIIIIILSYVTIQIYFFDKNFYYSLIARIPEFLIGSFTALIIEKHNISEKVKSSLGIVGFLMILFTAFLFSDKTIFPGFSVILPCIGAALILLTKDGIMNKILSFSPLVYIGKLSYSLYLWHWPIMAFVRYNNDVEKFSMLECVFITITTFFASVLSYHFIENKFLKTSKKSIYKTGIPIVLSLGLFIMFIPRLAINQHNELFDQYAKPSFGLLSHNKTEFERFGKDELDENDILLIGDSHCLATKPLFDYFGKEIGFAFNTISNDTYPPLIGLNRDEVKNDIINAGQYENFEQSKKSADFSKEKIENAKIIMLICTKYDRIPSEEKVVENLANSLRDDQKLIIFNSFPKLDKNPIRINKGIIKKKTVKYTLKQESIPLELKQIINEKENVFSFDLNVYNSFYKEPFYKDTVMYYDEGHLNKYGSIQLAKKILPEFHDFWQKNITNLIK